MELSTLILTTMTGTHNCLFLILRIIFIWDFNTKNHLLILIMISSKDMILIMGSTIYFCLWVAQVYILMCTMIMILQELIS